MVWIDLRTAVLIASLMSVLMAGVLYGAHLSFPRSVGGLKAWAVASVSMMAAALGFSLRGIVPDALSIVAANVFFALGYALMWSGTRQLLGARGLPRRWVAGALLVLAALLGTWTYLAPNFGARSILMAGIASVFYVGQAAMVWRARRSAVDVVYVALMLLAFLTTLSRVLAGLMPAGAATGIFSPTGVQSVYITAFSVLSLMHAMTFFLMATRHLQRELLAMARTDPLTGALNRRALMERAEGIVEIARRKGHDIALMLCDLDRFKGINDTHGHEAGDRVLCHFSSLVKGQKRRSDLFARLGGEEFVLLLPEADQAEAIASAQRLHATLNAGPTDGVPGYTTSIGISHLPADALRGDEPADAIIASLLRQADAALYQAKHNGRNRIEWAAPHPPQF
jgi:diguanylate cyclase (GGDEF)-like protein